MVFAHLSGWEPKSKHFKYKLIKLLAVCWYYTASALWCQYIRLLSPVSHCRFTAFQNEFQNQTFKRQSNAVTSQFLWRIVQWDNATQLQCTMNGSLVSSGSLSPVFLKEQHNQDHFLFKWNMTVLILDLQQLFLVCSVFINIT